MGLSLLVFTQLFSKVTFWDARCTGAKTEINVKYEREKPTGDSVSLYNNTGLISKFSEEIASKNAENHRYRQPHCRLTPTSPGNQRISQKPYTARK